MDVIYDVVIIGGGPAGLAAALYTSRAKLHTMIVEKEMIGGQLMNRDIIENYPSYPDGVLGPELGIKMQSQAMNYGTEFEIGEVEHIELNSNYKVVKTSEKDYWGKGIIVAGGAYPKKMGVPGEEEFADKGVFYCATCEGPSFADKVVAVAGAGDSGITEGLFLSRFVSKVIVVEMLPRPTATKILLERVASNPKMEIRCGQKIEAIIGDDEVNALNLLDVQTGKRYTLEVNGILVHIGLEPNTSYLNGTVPLDNRRLVLVNDKMETEVPGILAAGDIRHDSPMQIATAVGDGVTAALSLEKYLAGVTRG